MHLRGVESNCFVTDYCTPSGAGSRQARVIRLRAPSIFAVDKTPGGGAFHLVSSQEG